MGANKQDKPSKTSKFSFTHTKILQELFFKSNVYIHVLLKTSVYNLLP